MSRNNSRCQFDYFKSFNDLKQISGSFTLDLDLLSDSMAVQSCYVLSQSTNLSQKIRDDLSLYYKISLIVLLISILPKWNCYLFMILRIIVNKVGIINKQGMREQLVEQKNYLMKMIFQFYRLIARFYGINYNKEQKYEFSSKNSFKDIVRLFYVNHEDMFTAGQFNTAKRTVDLLNYDEMER